MFRNYRRYEKAFYVHGNKKHQVQVRNIETKDRGVVWSFITITNTGLWSTQIKALSTLTRFQTKMELFCSVFKTICVHTYRFRIVFPFHTTTPYLFWKRCYTLSAHALVNSMHAHFNISVRENWREIEGTWWRQSAILDTRGRVVWRPVMSILMTSPFSDSIVFSVHTTKQRFQKASFSNCSTLESVFEWRCFRWSFSAL